MKNSMQIRAGASAARLPRAQTAIQRREFVNLINGNAYGRISMNQGPLVPVAAFEE